MDKLIDNLRAIVGPGAVLSEPSELLVYECDALTQHKHLPRAVVLPSSTEETSEVMRELARAEIPFTPRGAGTGLSGGALALNRGVVIELARMRMILSIDEANRTVTVQTGVVNSHVSRAVANLGLHYVPDPSSQPSCTIGGNIAENAGGVHCLKYGTTTDHVLGARVVLAGGEVVDLINPASGAPGYDLLGVFVGSEGTFGIATEATLRLVPIPPAIRTLLAEFEEVNDASHAVSAIIAAGVMPAGLEMMDGEIIRAVEQSIFAAGLSQDIGAALLIELDGIEAGIDDEAERVKNICLDHHARNCRLARDENERKKLWAARKGAFGAIGRIAPDSMIQDAVVPRSRLPEVLAEAYRISTKYQLRLANVFHAGDGNLHPLICFDSRSPDDVRRVKEAGRELMETCVRAGGSITGEHGVGLDKRDFLPLIFSEDDIDTMLRVRRAFDPTGLCNPGKILPVLRGCGEARAVAGRWDGETVGWGDGEMGGRGEEAERNGNPGTGERLNVDGSSLGPRAFRPQQRAAGFNRDRTAGELSKIVGEANVSASPHLPVSSSSLLPLSATFRVTPGSVEEACEVMKLAHTERWSVLPAGAAAWLDAGNSLSRIDLVIRTERLNQILLHEPADLIASAQAGVTLEALNHTLAKARQWLPLDPPYADHSTLGGIVATGLGGPQKHAFGGPRNVVIGMKVIRADGKLVKAGGKVVKNVAGYDLCKLFTGSYGTLGLITELTFKLRPLPRRTWTTLAFGSVETLLDGAQKVISANFFPTAVELLSPAFTAYAEFAERNEAMLIVRFAGSHEEVEKQSLGVAELLGCGGPLAKDDYKLWREVSRLPINFKESCIWSAKLPPSHLSSFLGSIEPINGNSSGTSRMWHASVTDGHVRAIEPPNSDPNEVAELLRRLRSKAEAPGGSLVVENAKAEIKTKIDAWGDLGSRAKLMQRIKQQLDPQNLLSPGRFGF